MRITKKKAAVILLLILSCLAGVLAMASVKQGRAILQSWLILNERSYCLDGVNLTLGSNLVIDQIAKAGDAHTLMFGFFPVSRDLTRAPLHKNSIHIKQVRGDAAFLIGYDSSRVDWMSMRESCKSNGACVESVAPFSDEGMPALKIASVDAEWYQYKNPNILVGVIGLSDKSGMKDLRITAKSCK